MSVVVYLEHKLVISTLRETKYYIYIYMCVCVCVCVYNKSLNKVYNRVFSLDDTFLGNTCINKFLLIYCIQLIFTHSPQTLT